MVAITDLATLTGVSSGDYLVINDVSDGADKKTPLSEIGMAGGVMTKLLVLSTQSATISGGVITATASKITLEGEGSAADSLDTINGYVDGALLVLHTTGTQVTVKHNTGNIWLVGSADFVMSVRRDNLVLMYSSLQARWLEISRSDMA